MLSLGKIKKIFLGIIFLFLISVTAYVNPTYATPDESLYLGGFPAGFILNTQDVEVIGICDVFTDKGAFCPAREGGIKTGDIIREINGKQIKSANALTELLKEDYSTFKFTIQRGSETVYADLTPVNDRESGKKRLGILVRDSINGVGMVTYIDKNENKFASLGHPVTDDRGNLIEINGGTMYGCSIYEVKKGLRGNPGELKGIFDNTSKIGKVCANTKCGIYGEINDDFDTANLKKVQKGSMDEATMGKAEIISTLNGNTCKSYDISIVKVDRGNRDNRNYVIKIDDPELLNDAGGIVQGMSGSPILQGGKLIGAVTHVFVIIWIPAIAERHF